MKMIIDSPMVLGICFYVWELLKTRKLHYHLKFTIWFWLFMQCRDSGSVVTDFVGKISPQLYCACVVTGKSFS